MTEQTWEALGEGDVVRVILMGRAARVNDRLMLLECVDAQGRFYTYRVERPWTKDVHVVWPSMRVDRPDDTAPAPTKEEMDAFWNND